jgi:C-terminal processing protease CtpA/Prc
MSLEVKVSALSGEQDSLGALSASPEKSLVSRLGTFCIEIGRQVVQMFPELRRQYGLIVAAKSQDGQAQFIDLQAGDAIHAVNGARITSLADLRSTIDGFKHGDAVVLQIEREGRFQYVAFQME